MMSLIAGAVPWRGAFAGVIGPRLVAHTVDLSPPRLFAATFLAQPAVAGRCALILLGIPPDRGPSHGRGELML